ncbi:hypothetical protein ACQ4M4_00320 [Leptolyngbya sp. AN02str]|uniref:hypothetical protein n=1 Tax=Leptolyngbya sp. AN02str TaxID=3423363 RepID=UPI003D312FD6
MYKPALYGRSPLPYSVATPFSGEKCMVSARWLKVCMALCLSLLLFVTACSKAPSPYEQVQKDTTGWGAPKAVAKDAEKGSTFNQFFPSLKGFDVIPSQEKKGFAEYKVNKDGKTVAMLSINDTISLPTAAVKYQSATEQIAGYPTVEQGSTTTGILVNDRYQIKVMSRDPSFTREDRVDWLQKFDLRGIAKLEGTAANKALLPNNKPSIAPKLPPVLSPQPAG